MSSFDQRQWYIQERHFQASQQHHMETILTLGNGLFGIRGSFEEGFEEDSPLTLLNGIYNHKDGHLVPELVGMPHLFDCQIEIDGQLFSMNSGQILGYERFLDMQRALLIRRVLWLSPDNCLVRIEFERFVSLDNLHLIVLSVKVTLLSQGQHQIAARATYNLNKMNPDGTDHWRYKHIYPSHSTLIFHGETESNYQVVMNFDLQATSENTASFINQDQAAYKQLEGTLGYGESLTFIKRIACHSSRDSQSPLEAAQITLDAAKKVSYAHLKAQHASQWAQRWAVADIQIVGDELAQQALRFCIYHTLIAAPLTTDTISIPAKTLSGLGYKGHIFWDCELFSVPLLCLTEPATARQLLLYRYHMLEGAREKARENGFLGAMFPWESTDTGYETAPKWSYPDPLTGQRDRIWTGENEQHISSDIAYAVIQYWRWTADDEFMANFGAELVLDTAKFWLSRLEYQEITDSYELSHQIGPDEYHENINNNAFTNRLVAWHLKQAVNLLNWLTEYDLQIYQTLFIKLHLPNDFKNQCDQISQRIKIPFSDQETGLLLQFDDFFENLTEVNLKLYQPRTINMNYILGYENTQSLRVIKQADVLMLYALLGDEPDLKPYLRKNWDVYEPLCDQGSSLSPAIHAWIAAQLGLIDQAYDYFIYGATIDLHDLKGNVADGIHAAACGGTWQALIFGFAGLKIDPKGELVTNPQLPPHWHKLSFKIFYRDQLHTITLEQPPI